MDQGISNSQKGTDNQCVEMEWTECSLINAFQDISSLSSYYCLVN